ncbi:tol-pal system YbgF family protein [Streptomyces sp. NPDC001744]|uniref:tetratricopeptide repeat protein n=1 Tax=Streptomyces sp. NPDC001744 TaxID=3364606 RepID=UPI00367D8402
MIALHEEHGEVVASWTRLGYRAESVVCFDRHLDLKPLTRAAAARLTRPGGDRTVEDENRKLPIREVEGSYGLDDFYAAGATLGLVSGLTWVRATREADSPAARRRLLAALSVIAAEPDVLDTTRFDGRGALYTRVCGLDLAIHTPDTFGATPQDPAARVDLDLDWFADVRTGQDHRPDELLGLLDRHGLRGNVDSMTYSVRSGFLPEARRDLAPLLAGELARGLRQRERDALPLPQATFTALRGAADPVPPERYESELAPLGPVGTALLGLLHLHTAGDADRAARCWHEAARAGCRSSWLAYGIGLSHYGRRAFTEAGEWFRRATGERTDTIEVKSAFLAALCTLRNGAYEEAHRALLDFARHYPLHADAARLAAGLGDRLGIERQPWLTRRIDAHEQLIGNGAAA